VTRETVVHNRHLRRENDNACQTAAMTRLSCQPQTPCTNRVRRSQVKISANVLNIMAKALGSTSINSEPFTYEQAMDTPQREDWKRAMDEECTSIMLKNTFTTINSREERQLQVKVICSKLVYTIQYNPDGTIRYEAPLVSKGFEQTDIGETYAPVGKLTTFRYLISLVGKYGWNINHLDVVAGFFNPRLMTIISISPCPKAGRKVPTPQRSLFNERMYFTVSNKHHNFGTMILTPSCYLLCLHSPRPTPTTISTAIVF